VGALTLLAVGVLLVAGALGGVLAGLLGIGGGLVFVPALLWVVVATGIAPGSAMHVAVGSSLAAIVLTSSASVRTHQALGNIDWIVFRRLLPGLVVGAVAGASLAAITPGEWLRAVFAVFLVVVALRMFRSSAPAVDGRGAQNGPDGSLAGAAPAQERLRSLLRQAVGATGRKRGVFHLCGGLALRVQHARRQMHEALHTARGGVEVEVFDQLRVHAPEMPRVG